MRLLGALLLGLAAPAQPQPLADPERADVVAKAAALIEERYVDGDEGKRIATNLIKAKWTASEPRRFAEEVTVWLRRFPAMGTLASAIAKRRYRRMPAMPAFPPWKWRNGTVRS